MTININNLNKLIGAKDMPEPVNSWALAHKAGFDNGIVKREGNYTTMRLYINPLKTMSVMAVYLGVEGAADTHLELSRDPNCPYREGIMYQLVVYTSWNSNDRFLTKTDKGWVLFYDVTKSAGKGKTVRQRIERVVSQARVYGIIGVMKKRTAKGFRMRLEFGGQEEEYP